MTRQEGSGTRSCSSPSRNGLGCMCRGLYVSEGRAQRAEGRRPPPQPHVREGGGLLRPALCALPSDITRVMTWQYQPRVAVIRGVRTPFAKSGTHYGHLSALDLGKLAVTELMQRSGINPADVQELVFGNVIPSVKAPNIAREIILGTGLPRKIPGYSVSKACASANQAITAASDMIARGYADTVIAGGSESLSDVPILFSKNFSDALVGASKQKSVGGKLGVFSKVKLKDLAPDAPAIAESTTGLTMGES